jgi:hypothetical protein
MDMEIYIKNMSRNALFFLLTISITCCGEKQKVNDEMLDKLKKILPYHKGLSIGNRGDAKILTLNNGNNATFFILEYDSINYLYKIKDVKLPHQLDAIKIHFNLDKNEKAEPFFDTINNYINTIIETSQDLSIIASNCLEDQSDCIDCIFWFDIETQLLLLKSDTCKMTGYNLIYYKNDKWLGVKLNRSQH